MAKTILLTGAAGFIGYHVALELLKRGDKVIGLDNFNQYYNPALKEARAANLEKFPLFYMYRAELTDSLTLSEIFKKNKIDKVCHLAAQAGVRYSLEQPSLYIQSNVLGFTNLLESTKNAGVSDFIFASSSSVYGNSNKLSFSESDNADMPLSIYAATKRADELIAYSYHHLFGMNCTALRFFSAYGSWGRPDMAYFSFARSIFAGEPIKVFNNGKMKRDFTHISDIATGVVASLDKAFSFETFNLGNNKSVELEKLISLLEKEIGTPAIREYLPHQPGDMLETCADITHAKQLLGFEPRVNLEEGIKEFIDWLKCNKQFL